MYLGGGGLSYRKNSSYFRYLGTIQKKYQLADTLAAASADSAPVIFIRRMHRPRINGGRGIGPDDMIATRFIRRLR